MSGEMVASPKLRRSRWHGLRLPAIAILVALNATLATSFSVCDTTDLRTVAATARSLAREHRDSFDYRGNLECIGEDWYLTDSFPPNSTAGTSQKTTVTVRKWSASHQAFIGLGDWEIAAGRLLSLVLVSIGPEAAVFCGVNEVEDQGARFVCWRGRFDADVKRLTDLSAAAKNVRSNAVAVSENEELSETILFFVEEKSERVTGAVLESSLNATSLVGISDQRRPVTFYRAKKGKSVQDTAIDVVALDDGFLVAWINEENIRRPSRDVLVWDQVVHVQRLAENLRPVGMPWRQKVEGLAFAGKVFITGQAGEDLAGAIAVTVAGSREETESWLVDSPEIHGLGGQVPAVRIDPRLFDVFEFPAGLLEDSGSETSPPNQ